MFPVKSSLEDRDRRDLDNSDWSDCGNAVGDGCASSGHVSCARGNDTMPRPVNDTKPRPADKAFGARLGGGKHNKHCFLYTSCAVNPGLAISYRKSIIAEVLVRGLAQPYKNIATYFCLNRSKTLSVVDKSVQSRVSLSPALARREGQNIFSKEIGRCDLIHAIVGIIRSRISEGVSASTMKQHG
jgi:hypothetical protein